MAGYVVIIAVFAFATVLVGYLALIGREISRSSLLALPVATVAISLFALLAEADDPLFFSLGLAMVGMVIVMALAIIASVFFRSGQ